MTVQDATIAESATQEDSHWQAICPLDALIENAGVCALLSDNRQIAIFYLPLMTPSIYVVDNYDPIGQANVLYRGIIGSVEVCDSQSGDTTQEPFVASPLFKQQFSLATGQCLQQDKVRLRTFDVRVRDDMVQLKLQA